MLVESGGDNLTATFSKGLVDRQIFVVDVAGGDKVPRKGGPGVTSADLLVINKTDLAPLVGADLSVMERDAAARRGALPTVFLSLVAGPGGHPGGRLGPVGLLNADEGRGPASSSRPTVRAAAGSRSATARPRCCRAAPAARRRPR